MWVCGFSYGYSFCFSDGIREPMIYVLDVHLFVGAGSGAEGKAVVGSPVISRALR